MSQALKKILVAVDYSSHAADALRYAAAMAGPSTELLAVHVIAKEVAVQRRRSTPAMPWHAPMYAAVARSGSLVTTDLREQADTALERYLATELPGASVKRRVAVGRPATAILAVAKEEAVDLIVMGTQSRTGLSRIMMGSVAEQVDRHATCPVLTLRASAPMAA